MMTRFLQKAFLIVVLVLTGNIEPITAQQFDYQKHPALSVDITHLNLDLEVNPEEKSLAGNASYQLKTRIAGLDSLILHAAHMEIEKTLVNGKMAEFRLHNDSLFIPLADSAAAGEIFEVSIMYSTSPKFGLLKNEAGTVWTSLLPKSTRHWLPVIDHPRIMLTGRITLRVPRGYQAIASGRQTAVETGAKSSVAYTFETERAVPVSALSFAVGNFSSKETSFGIKNIRIKTEQNLLTSQKQNELLENAYEILKQTEQYLGMEFPFKQLNIAVLKDHTWETKSWGASTVFLYANRGNLEAQLRRGIYAQWFGVQQREEQWAEAAALPLLQSVLHTQLSQKPILLEQTDVPGSMAPSVYDVFGVPAWNRLQKEYQPAMSANWRQTISKSLKPIARWDGGVYSLYDYATYWYEQSGQPRFEISSFEKADSSLMPSDSLVYRVDYDLNEQEGKLKLIFKAKNGMVDELMSVPLISTSVNASDTSKVTFTGAQDSVIVTVPALVKTVHLDGSSNPGLVFDEYKPASFLIYEIRHAGSITQKAEAARKLSIHTDNPDLQLAVTDLLNQKTAPPVRAALLYSFSQITRGASGTQQVFLDALKSDNNEVQLAALSALQNYAGSEGVVSSVKAFASSVTSLPDFKNATKIYGSVADTAVFKDFVNATVQSDTAGYKAIFAIQELANLGVVDQAVTLAQYYISDVYDYSIRASALRILLQYDKAIEDWRSRAGELFNDGDPRIRFLLVNGLPTITGLNPQEILPAYIQDEYDARVYAAMEEVIDK